MELIFQKGTGFTAIKVQGKNLFFAQVKGHYCQFAPIDGLRFSIPGIIKEFPDLKGKPIDEIRKIGINRFKKHFASLKTKKEIIDYLKEDLAKHGYKLRKINKPGFRPINVK